MVQLTKLSVAALGFFQLNIAVAGGCVQSRLQEPQEQTPSELLHDCTPSGNPSLIPHYHELLHSGYESIATKCIVNGIIMVNIPYSGKIALILVNHSPKQIGKF